MKPMTPKYAAKKPAVKKLVKGLATEADPKRYNAKTGYYGYPLQDYKARNGGFGSTNAITQTLGRTR